MNRINLVRSNSATANSVAWGKITTSNFEKTAGTAVFAAALILCSLAVGCSSDKAKTSSTIAPAPVSSIPAPQTLASAAPAPVPAESKPAAKKVVRKRPANVTYVDKTYGVSFEYPRRYALETGDSASQVVSSSALPMNFVAPGGNALAAVELPETGFGNTDFASAFFNVSVNTGVSAEDCGKFAVPKEEAAPMPQTAVAESASKTDSNSNQASAVQNAPGPAVEQPKQETAKISDSQPETKLAESNAPATAGSEMAAQTVSAPKIMLSDMETRKAEAVSGAANRQSDSKYVHVYQNGACYEFAMNVTTVAGQSDGEMKHVDRDKVFGRLEKILATVKINPVEGEKEAAKESKEPANAASTAAAGTPAQ